MKKLSLKKTTIANLSADAQQRIMGGATLGCISKPVTECNCMGVNPKTSA